MQNKWHIETQSGQTYDVNYIPDCPKCRSMMLEVAGIKSELESWKAWGKKIQGKVKQK